MPKLAVNLWLAEGAKEAAEFYVDVFGEGKIRGVQEMTDTPSGEVVVVDLSLLGFDLTLMATPSEFRLNPSISLMVMSRSKEEVEERWKKLIDGGEALMELDEYPFSAKYGWLADKYGVTWQLMQVDEEVGQRVVPTLMFTGEVAGKAEEAMKEYAIVFGGRVMEDIARYEAGEGPDEPGTVKHAEVEIGGVKVAVMDSAMDHKFNFNEAISLVVEAETQEEVDHYWNQLSAVPEAEACGWLKDRYGVSWQIVPKQLNEMMAKGNREQVDRLTQELLKMKKLEIDELERAFRGEG